MSAEKNTEIGEDVVHKTANKISGKLGIRHLQVLLLFWGMIIAYCLRVCMSEAVVAMSNSSAANNSAETFPWTPMERSQILSSFFWGYTLTQIPCGYLAGVWSAQRLVSYGIFFCGVFNILVPMAAHYGGMSAVCACRVGMGLCQGALLPCVHTLLSKWAPPSERARLGTFAYAGAQLGTVIAFPISGFLADSSVGWPSIFYVFGAAAIAWGVLFYFIGADNPSLHPKITDGEKKYIESSLRAAQISDAPVAEGRLKTPWKHIFTSLPMWALIIAHSGQNWGYWTLLTEMPSYMHSVLHFDMKENGGVSAIPYLAMWLLSFPASWLSDHALKKGVTREVIRKVSNTIAHWGPAVALACLGFVPPGDVTITVLILVIAVGLNAGSLCGFQINHIDLSPNFAGTMMSITNCFASVVAIIAPLICGDIVREPHNVEQWMTVFYIAAAVYFVANLLFIILGKAEVQWWDQPGAKRPEKTKEVLVTVKIAMEPRETNSRMD